MSLTNLFNVKTVALAAAIAFGSTAPATITAEEISVETLQAISQYSMMSSALVHEIKKERGFAAGYLYSNGKVYAEELAQQQTATDQKIAALKKFVASFEGGKYCRNFEVAMVKLMDDLAAIRDQRESVINGGTNVQVAMEYYNSIHNRLNESVGDLFNAQNQRLSTASL